VTFRTRLNLGYEAPPHGPKVRNGTKVRVLLIDDDEDEAVLTRSMLTQADNVRYAMDWASSFEEGLAAVARGEHEAYLVDHHLGAQTGTDLVRASRASGSRAPLIMLTGERNPFTDRAALQAGASDFLEKSKTDTGILDRTLRYAIARTEILDELERAREQLAGLEELGRLLLEEGPSASTLDRVAGIMAGRFAISYLAIYVAHEGDLRLLASRGYAMPSATLSPADAAVHRVVRTRQPQVVSNISMPATDQGADYGVPVELVVPLLAGGNLVGLLNAGSPTASPLELPDHAIIRIVADRLSVVLATANERDRVDERLATARRDANQRRASDAAAVRDTFTGLYSEAFLGAFVERLSAPRDGRPFVPDVTLVILGFAVEDPNAPQSGTLTTLATTAFAGQLVARHGTSEVAVVAIGMTTAAAIRAARGMISSGHSGATGVVAGCASLETHDDYRSLASRANAALMKARVLGAGSVVG
jgi:FixJ family two-component response regulator